MTTQTIEERLAEIDARMNAKLNYEAFCWEEDLVWMRELVDELQTEIQQMNEDLIRIYNV